MVLLREWGAGTLLHLLHQLILSEELLDRLGVR